jgi:hypothetical protein
MSDTCYNYYDSQDDMALNQLPPYDPQATVESLTSIQKQQELEKVKHIILNDPQWQNKLVNHPATAPTYADYCQLYQQTPPKPNPPPSSENCVYSWPSMIRLLDPEILEIFPYIGILCMIKPSNSHVNETLAVFDMFVSSTKFIRESNNDPEWQAILFKVSEEAKLWLDKARLVSHQDGYFKL